MSQLENQTEEPIECDVAIVGAGFTGLTAATELKKAGLDIVVLEARDTVGGRVEAHAFADGIEVDAGGQFFCRDMVHVVSLAETYGRPVVMSHATGEVISQPPLPKGKAEELWESVDGLRDRMIATDLADPAVSNLTVAGWLQEQTDVPDDVAQSFRRMVKGLWCRSPEEISFAYLASNDRRVTNKYPELEMIIDGTMHMLAADMAAGLGDRLIIGSPVTAITTSPESVTLTTQKRLVRARQVLLAVPPIMARRLSFSPALPDRFTRALDAWSAGMAMKFNIRYAEPFWRKQGLSGLVMWRDPQGIFACDASHGDYCGLIIFVGGPQAGIWHERPADEIRREIVSRLVAALGEEAGRFTEIHLRDWVDDPWSDGAYSDVITDLGSPDAEAVLLEGLGNLHFAASELSPSFPGYVEGAIVAGKIAAEKITHAFQAKTER
nr:FAD-dependent oxidoreductase [Neorhizobium alkalisoli]